MRKCILLCLFLSFTSTTALKLLVEKADGSSTGGKVKEKEDKKEEDKKETTLDGSTGSKRKEKEDKKETTLDGEDKKKEDKKETTKSQKTSHSDKLNNGDGYDKLGGVVTTDIRFGKFGDTDVGGLAEFGASAVTDHFLGDAVTALNGQAEKWKTMWNVFSGETSLKDGIKDFAGKTLVEANGMADTYSNLENDGLAAVTPLLDKFENTGFYKSTIGEVLPEEVSPSKAAGYFVRNSYVGKMSDAKNYVVDNVGGIFTGDVKVGTGLKNIAGDAVNAAKDKFNEVKDGTKKVGNTIGDVFKKGGRRRRRWR